jgi:hypothetical protein
MKKKNIKVGGDGYVINVNEAIGGLPAYSRYSNNYRPVFCGDLLQCGEQSGGLNKKLSENLVNKNLINKKLINKNNKLNKLNKPNVLNENLQNGSGCGCNSKSDVYDPSIFDLIKQSGGMKKKDTNKITQFYAIRKISETLTPLSTNSLIKLNLNLFLKTLSNKKSNLKKKKSIWRIF